MTDLTSIASEDALEDALSKPDDALINTMSNMKGPLLILGIGGKMGPSIARMARRALDAAESDIDVIGVARFSEEGLREQLEGWDIHTMQADLLEPGVIDALPIAPNVLYMAAMKFGTSSDPSLTWAMNCYLPGRVAERYRDSNIVAFSTGNVYPLVPIDSGGSKEDYALAPEGEYAMSALGRERLFTSNSKRHGTPTALIRLNYACDLRYGVLVDIAQKVWSEEPVDITMGYFNTIWQRDANAITLRCFDHVNAPPYVLNLTGERRMNTREAAEQFATIMNKQLSTIGEEATDALLSDASKCHATFGPLTVEEDALIEGVAHWIQSEGRTLDKPTKFQVRDGKF